jgi:hypothetical protein
MITPMITEIPPYGWHNTLYLGRRLMAWLYMYFISKRMEVAGGELKGVIIILYI